MRGTNNQKLEKALESGKHGIRLVPPDGGWGWLIVAANFFLGILIHSLTTSYGVVYMSLVQHGFSNTAASGIPALLTGISCLIGPFSTSLSLYYSYRKLAMIGIVLLVTGLFLSSITLQLPWLYFTYGVIGGTGHSLVTPQIFMIGQQYFHKKRVTSHALSSLGNTIGFMIMPIIVYNLIQFYSLRGTFLIWSAILLNGIVAAMFFHPVKWHLKKEFEEEEQLPINGSQIVENGPEKAINKNAEKHIDKNETLMEENPKKRDSSSSSLDSYEDLTNKIESEDYFSEHIENEIYYDTTGNGRPLSFLSFKSMDSFKTTKSYYKSTETIMVSCLNLLDTVGSVISLRNREGELQNESKSSPHEGDFDTNEEKVVEKGSNPFIVCGLKFPRISEILSIKLLSNPIFIIYVISSISTRQFYNSFQTYLPTIAQEVIPQNEVPYLYSIIATVEIFAKLCMAFVSDQGWLARRYFYILGSIVNCIAITGFAASHSFLYLGLASALYGLGLGISASVGPVLLVEHLSISLLPYTYGLSLFIGGFFNFLVYFIQGWTIDVTGSTQVLCFIIASMALIPAILWSLASIFLLRQNVDTD